MTERKRVNSGSPFESQIGFSRAVRVGKHLHVSGTGPIWDDGSLDDEPGAQARRCLEIIVDALEGLGRGVAEEPRAATAVVVSGLLDPRWKVEIEADAIVG
jgi:enamine deaminase RidA (YjgF/YER057c/UK114 family)